MSLWELGLGQSGRCRGIIWIGGGGDDRHRALLN